MTTIFRGLLACALVTISVVVCQNFNCPQPSGQFEFPGDCTQYLQCDNGVATPVPCPAQLIFNSQSRVCDWPHTVPNPNCVSPARNAVSPANADLCRNVPAGVQANQAFSVGHPELCNAFYTCSAGYVYAPCTFCPEGSYFSREAGGCRDYLITGLDRNFLCGGTQFVEHPDKVFRQLDGICWPYNTPNAFAALLAALRG